jgi:lipopolysaccharide transport system permease protein
VSEVDLAVRRTPAEQPPSAMKPIERGMLREIWAFRELIYFLAWRDVKVRYKQTVLGLLWAVVQPLFTMVVFTLFFSRLAGIPTDGMPGPIFYFSALVPWIYFSNTLSNAGMSLVGNSGLLTKIYFPRIILPAATALSNVVDFLVSSLFLVGFIVYYQVPVGWNLLLWPLLLVLLMVLALGLGVFFAALNVKYRDVKYALPFLIQLLLFVTPIIYPASMIPARYQWLLSLNPLSALIEMFRRAVVPDRPIDWTGFGVAVAVIAVVFVAGVAYFKSTEKAMADLV